MTFSIARVVHKDRYDEQHYFDVAGSTLPSLEDSWVRVRSRLITISSMNLSYCFMGRALAWWDEVPLPPSLPTPFNDRSEYGVAPGWGVGEVIESRKSELPIGTPIYGHMPTSAFPFDLCLNRSANIASHWIDVSEQRKKLMSAYNRFVVIPRAFEPDHELKTALTLALQIPFETGYVLNRFVFASWPGDSPIHPFPEQKLTWSVEDSNLKEAIVIALAAGGKSCRAFTQQLSTNRAPGSGPAGLIEITSSQASGIDGIQIPFAHRVVQYEDAMTSELASWILARNPRRIIITDFGGRNNIIEPLEQHLRTYMPQIKLDIIGVGREAQFNPKAAASAKNLSGVMMNTSGIRVAAIEQLGEAQYFQQSDVAFHKMIEAECERATKTAQDDRLLGVKIDVRDGMRGDKGFEQAWNDLCAGCLSGDQALIFRV